MRKAALFVGLLVAPALLAAPPNNRRYQNDAMGVRLFAPPIGWDKQPQSSYPRLLAAYSHREGGRMTLAAQKVPPGTTPEKLATEARASLERQGFAQVALRPDGERVRIEATLDGGKKIARQVYLVQGGIGYVITLIAPAPGTQALADLEETLRSLVLASGGGGGDGG
jgi:hypothetical protein